MKKIIIGIGLFLSLLLVLFGFVFFANTFIFTQSKSQEKPTETTEVVPSTETKQSTKKQTANAPNEGQEARSKWLSEFGEKWVNYSSINSRNQSVRTYFTDEAAKENGLDVDPRMEIEGNGEIRQIFQSLDDQSTYVLLGEERVREVVSDIMLEVTIDKEKERISKLTVRYVRQAY